MYDLFTEYVLSLLNQLWYWVEWLLGQLRWLVEQIGQGFAWLWNQVQTFAGWVVGLFKSIGSALWRGLKALTHLKFGDIWKAIKRGYDRFLRALAWFQKRILEPIDRMRRQIWDIYRRFFRPILLMIDRFRSLVRILAIFNRRLAAKLDAKFLWLEAKLMYPITETLHRLNALSSHYMALVTALGYLDRSTLLASLRRDTRLVWEVLTNPRAALFAPPDTTPGPGLREMGADLQLLARSRAGPLADSVDELQRVAEEALLEV
jgi:hypothetical protein